ncbi:hypothetical protein [Streptomyces sp. 7N604]|uniref:hypothetical protein n=1 Tax=Streptomyces sp. 7N604 TaxID=3457415 RepID=UPI003FD5EA07
MIRLVFTDRGNTLRSGLGHSVTFPTLKRDWETLLRASSDPESVPAAGGVVYEDAHVMLLRDPVRFPFPDGRTGTCTRSVGAIQEPGCVVLPLLGREVVLLEHFRHATRSWHLGGAARLRARLAGLNT